MGCPDRKDTEFSDLSRSGGSLFVSASGVRSGGVPAVLGGKYPAAVFAGGVVLFSNAWCRRHQAVLCHRRADGGRSLILCMAVSFLLGALVSLVLLIRRRNLKKRLLYFIAYIGRFYQTRQWVPYRDKRDRSGEFCFTVPIFLSVLLYMGGVY